MVKETVEGLNKITNEIIKAAIEVHKVLGPGFLESVYEMALACEFTSCGIAFERQKPIRVLYKGNAIGESRLDFLVSEKVVVELKAVDALAPIHTAQVLSYLKATGYNVALLINFNAVKLTSGVKRIVRT